MTQKIVRHTSFLIATLLMVVTTGISQARADTGAMNRGWVGVVLGDTDSQDGVVIDTVLRRSPAFSAGIEDGDRILSVNGEGVRTPGKVQSLFRGQPVGRTLALQLERANERIEINVELTPSPASSEVHRLHLQGFAAPDISLLDREGASIDLTELNDRPLVLEFWATWCSVCRQVSRKLEAAVDAAPDRFHVLAVTSEDASTVQDHLTTRPMKVDIALDPDARAHDSFLVNSYPVLVVIDPDGTVRDVGTSLTQIDEIIARLIQEETH